jgi:hypothetical protein
MQDETVVTPFWQRIPRFFAYPADFGVLAFLGILSLASLSIFSFFLLFLYLAGLFLFFKYAFGVLRHTAMGHLSPPAVTTDLLAGTNLLVLSQALVLLLMGSAAVLAGITLGAWAMVLTAFALLALLPASTMVLGVSQDLLKAVNPSLLVEMIGRIGAPYWLLYGFLLLLYLSSWTMSSLLASGGIGIVLFWLLFNFVSMYFTLIMFNMMGYVVYQYHEQLGLAVEVGFDAVHGGAASAGEGREHPLMTRARQQVREGDAEGAIATLEQGLRSLKPHMGIHEQYHKLLGLTGKTDKLADHTNFMLGIHMEQGDLRRALSLFEDCRARRPGYPVPNPDDVYPLAEYAESVGRYKTALNIMNRFGERFRGHPDLPRVYLLSARILSDRMGRDAEAVKILEFLDRKFPEHELGGEIRHRLELLRRVTGDRRGA